MSDRIKEIREKHRNCEDYYCASKFLLSTIDRLEKKLKSSENIRHAEKEILIKEIAENEELRARLRASEKIINQENSFWKDRACCLPTNNWGHTPECVREKLKKAEARLKQIDNCKPMMEGKI